MQPDAIRARVIRARSDMVADEPFFGVLALRLTLKDDPTCTALWSDGATLGYNPVYVDRITDVELRGLVAATVFKVVAGHPWRQDSREGVRWNKACALVTHASVVQAGFRLPADAILDPEFDGKSAEFVYQQLPPEPEQPERPAQREQTPQKPDPSDEGGEVAVGGANEGDDEGQQTAGAGAVEDDGGDCGAGSGAPAGAGASDGGPRPELLSEIRPAPEDTPQLEDEWKQAAYDATFMQGDLPGGVLQTVDDIQKSRVDWRSATWSFFRAASGRGGRSTLTRVNTRYAASGLLLPGRRKRQMKAMVVVRDTSMSMNQYLGLLNGELVDIIDSLKPEAVYVLDVDAAVQRVQTVLDADDTELVRDMVGGGGTDFRPAFQWVEGEDVEVACLVYLTDLIGYFPDEAPHYPVLWAVPEGSNGRREPPFGDMVELELE